MPAEALQFLGSLAAILALAGLAYWLKLGPSPKFGNEDAVRAAAAEAVDGFKASLIAIDREQGKALACDDAGRVMLLRGHGTHFAARLLSPMASARMDGDELIIDTAEKRFGSARLAIDDPQAWVQRIEAIG